MISFRMRQVFYRIISRNSKGGAVPIDKLLERLEVPLLLLRPGGDQPHQAATRAAGYG